MYYKIDFKDQNTEKFALTCWLGESTKKQAQEKANEGIKEGQANGHNYTAKICALSKEEYFYQKENYVRIQLVQDYRNSLGSRTLLTPDELNRISNDTAEYEQALLFFQEKTNGEKFIKAKANLETMTAKQYLDYLDRLAKSRITNTDKDLANEIKHFSRNKLFRENP